MARKSRKKISRNKKFTKKGWSSSKTSAGMPAKIAMQALQNVKGKPSVFLVHSKNTTSTKRPGGPFLNPAVSEFQKGREDTRQLIEKKKRKRRY